MLVYREDIQFNVWFHYNLHYMFFYIHMVGSKHCECNNASAWFVFVFTSWPSLHFIFNLISCTFQLVSGYKWWINSVEKCIDLTARAAQTRTSCFWSSPHTRVHCSTIGGWRNHRCLIVHSSPLERRHSVHAGSYTEVVNASSRRAGSEAPAVSCMDKFPNIPCVALWTDRTCLWLA